MKGILLHGGSGTRLRPITYSEVKQLLPIGGKPISEYALEDMVSIGIKDVNIIVGHLGADEVRAHFGDGSKWNIRISYTHQEKPMGIAHAVSLCEDFIKNDPFVVYLGDNIVHGGIEELRKKFSSQNPDALLAVAKVTSPEKFGVVEFSNDRLVRLTEKPSHPASPYALVGIYFLKPSIFGILKRLKPSARGEYEITDALQMMISEGLDVKHQVISGWWKDTGTMEDVIDANRLVLDEIERSIPAEMENSPNIMGRVAIMPGVTVDGATKMKGPCYIGRDTRITNAYIGPYTSVGNNCVIENAEVEDSILMNNCVISGGGSVRIQESLLGTATMISHGNRVNKATRILVGRNSEIVF